jgi:hypothetical protein
VYVCMYVYSEYETLMKLVLKPFGGTLVRLGGASRWEDGDGRLGTETSLPSPNAQVSAVSYDFGS